MICDKCGFEHNSKSVCPKCGARVIYVNEDYLRRKEEWEKAQKAGTAGAIPPGIMHSTKEEHDREKGRDTVVSRESYGRQNTQKGGSETAGLSFDVARNAVLKFVAGVIVFFKKHFGRRKPAEVIRELKFDDGKETLDTSNLVVSHKIFKDKLRPVFISMAAVIFTAAAAVIIINVIRNIDHSRVLYYDGKYAYLSDDAGNALWGSTDGGMTMISAGDNAVIGYDSDGIYIYSYGKKHTIEASIASLAAYNERLNGIVYTTTDGGVFYTNGTDSLKIDIDVAQGFTHACKVSDNGKYYVLTTSSESSDFSSGESSFYVGDSDGNLTLISRDNNDKDVLRVCDDGTVVYIDMETGDYGIVNSRKIMKYADDSVTQITDGLSKYRTSGDEVYYLTTDGRICMTRMSQDGYVTVLDSEVQDLSDNLADTGTGIIYRKNDGYYYAGADAEAVRINKCKEDADCIWYEENVINYYIYDGKFYSASGASDKALFEINDPDKAVYSSESEYIAAVSSDGNLHIVTGSSDRETVAADSVGKIANHKGVIYTDDNIAYLIVKPDGKPKKLADISGGIGRAFYSGHRYYIVNDKNILYNVKQSGRNSENAGYVSFIDLMEK
ncbi:MAG: hypothetical protein PUB17_08995 [Lachnospiraceae bacterium]|nr:hypothetical protein [Lachnospiraceae bacterium]